MLDSLRSRPLLAPLFFFVIVACEDEQPTPAYGMSPATPPAAQAPQQIEDDGAGDQAQMQDVPVGVQQDDYADTDPSALTDFHTALDPHGTWVDDPTYGTIWVPNADEVGPDFAPYVSNGGWEYDDDYVWNSYYDWGWAPFHYGRWMWVDSGRWGWIPGRRYSGAWVNWRTGPEGYGYVGWGPAQPSYVWRGGVAVSFGVVRPGPTVFCGRDELFTRGVGAHVIVGPRAATIAAGTHEYVRADAVADGRPTAQGMMRGPPPASLGIRDSAVVHVSANERGLTQAKGFARPSTAQALGAHAPTSHVVRVTRPRPVSAPVSAPRAAPRAPARSGGGHRR
jgi:hypothetical protein